MSKRGKASCSICYFRQAGLCAIPGEVVCPTFRAQATRLAPPSQAALVPRVVAAPAVA